MMENFNRMTIRAKAGSCQVFKMKRERAGGWATDGAAQHFSYSVSRAAAPRFEGNYGDCLKFIEECGAVFMTEHGIAC